MQKAWYPLFVLYLDRPFGGQRSLQSMANNLAGVGIGKQKQIAKTSPDQEVSNISHPDLIRPVNDQIRDQVRMVRCCGICVTSG